MNLLCEDEKYQRYDVFFNVCNSLDDIEFLENKYKTDIVWIFQDFMKEMIYQCRTTLSIMIFIAETHALVRGNVFEANYSEDMAIFIDLLSFIY